MFDVMNPEHSGRLAARVLSTCNPGKTDRRLWRAGES